MLLLNARVDGLGVAVLVILEEVDTHCCYTIFKLHTYAGNIFISCFTISKKIYMLL